MTYLRSWFKSPPPGPLPPRVDEVYGLAPKATTVATPTPMLDMRERAALDFVMFNKSTYDFRLTLINAKANGVKPSSEEEALLRS